MTASLEVTCLLLRCSVSLPASYCFADTVSRLDTSKLALWLLKNTKRKKKAQWNQNVTWEGLRGRVCWKIKPYASCHPTCWKKLREIEWNAPWRRWWVTNAILRVAGTQRQRCLFGPRFTLPSLGSDSTWSQPAARHHSAAHRHEGGHRWNVDDDSAECKNWRFVDV